jgi:hypothetical protein
MVKKSDSKLLEETKNIIRLKHYSIHTERTYCGWIKRYISFHNMKNRDDPNNGESKRDQKKPVSFNDKYPFLVTIT